MAVVASGRELAIRCEIFIVFIEVVIGCKCVSGVSAVHNNFLIVLNSEARTTANRTAR